MGFAQASTINGKVVGVADGDTITVLEGTTQHKIRLYGIDCPEMGQDFGSRAKQFVTDMIGGEQVKVHQITTPGPTMDQSTLWRANPSGCIRGQPDRFSPVNRKASGSMLTPPTR